MSKLTRNEPIVFHFRLGRGTQTQAKAGATVVFLPECKRFGLALCCDKDRYNRKWGRKIATHRAKEGVRSLQNRRFHSNMYYDGLLEFEQVKAAAEILALKAATQVDNPVRGFLSWGTTPTRYDEDDFT